MVEEIKMLLPLLEQVSDGAYWIVILFLSKSLLLNLIGFALGFFVVSAVSKFVYRFVANEQLDNWLYYTKDLRLQERKVVLNKLSGMTKREIMEI